MTLHACMLCWFPVKNWLRDNMSINMHGTALFLTPVYISLYFPVSSNRDRSMLFLTLSYLYSEQCWSYINNVCPFVSFMIWCSVHTAPALCNHTTFAENREAQLVPRSIRWRRKTDDHSHGSHGSPTFQKPHYVQAAWNTWVWEEWLLCLWAGYQLVGAFWIFELEAGKQPWLTLSVSRTQLSD